MKTIFQLAKLGRRLPRLQTRAVKKLTRDALRPKDSDLKLTDNQVAHYRGVIASVPLMQKSLAGTLASRNVGGKPFRDATPHKLRRQSVGVSLHDETGKNATPGAPVEGIQQTLGRAA